MSLAHAGHIRHLLSETPWYVAAGNAHDSHYHGSGIELWPGLHGTRSQKSPHHRLLAIHVHAGLWQQHTAVGTVCPDSKHYHQFIYADA